MLFRSRRLEIAVDLNPNLVWGHAWLGMALASLGEYEKALASVETALRLSPRDPFKAGWHSMAGYTAFGAGDYEDAIRWCQRGLDAQADHPGVLRVMAASYGQLGRLEEARATITALLRAAPGITVESTRAQIPWEDPAAMERYVDGLRKAGLPES